MLYWSCLSCDHVIDLFNVLVLHHLFVVWETVVCFAFFHGSQNGRTVVDIFLCNQVISFYIITYLLILVKILGILKKI